MKFEHGLKFKMEAMQDGYFGSVSGYRVITYAGD